MHRRHFISSSRFVSGLIVTSLTLSMAMIARPQLASAETPWESAGGPATSTQAAAHKKKKKTKKRMRAGTATKGRAQASTSQRARYLAQSDLDSDLGNNDLEADLAKETDEAAAAPAAPTAGAPVATAAVGDEVQIQDIQYDSKKDGGTVIIATTGAATYRTREIPSQNQVVVEIANAKLPDRLKRPFNTKDFKQSIVSINAYQEAGSNTARVVFQYRQPRSVDVRQNGTTLTVVTTNGAGSPGGAATPKAAVAQLPKSDDFGDEEVAEGATQSENVDLASGEDEGSGSAAAQIYVGGSRANREARESSGGEAPARATVSAGSGKILPSSTLEQERVGDVRFYGKPISLEVRDTPVRDVITLISDQSGANIIISDDVQGSITIKLRQVPWDQALSIIMKTRGLGYVRQGGVLRIAPVRQLQAEAEEARRIIEAQEATLPLRVKVIPVSFASVTMLVTQIRNTLQTTNAVPGAPTGGAAGQQSRGRIEADPRSSSLIVTDTDENIHRIEQLVRALDIAPLQVMIEGKIVEANEQAGRRLGINWGYQGQDLGFAGGTLSHNATIAPTIGAANTTLDLKLGTLDFLGDLNAKLSLFENESMAKIISSPRVITMNNQAATITQSVQIPIPSTTTVIGSAPQTTITYRPVPTTLNVTPQITSGGDVLMQINFTREFQGASSGSSVAIESRDIRTNVMVKNGQTTVIGGIYQADQTDSEEGTPFLRSIPVVGWLFKSTSKSTSRNELLVFITPRILNADRTLPKSGAVH